MWWQNKTRRYGTGEEDKRREREMMYVWVKAVMNENATWDLVKREQGKRGRLAWRVV